MANSESAKKRVRQNANRRAINRWRKNTYRDAIKDFRELILHGSVEACEAKLTELYKILDQTASNPAMHRNTASRYKSRLTSQLNRKRAGAAA